MLGERRKYKRHVLNRMAKFRTDLGGLPRDCMITDISEQGARLFIEGLDVPEQFHLIVSGADGAQHECRVVWRLGGEVGVSFIGRPLRRAS